MDKFNFEYFYLINFSYQKITLKHNSGVTFQNNNFSSVMVTSEANCARVKIPKTLHQTTQILTERLGDQTWVNINIPKKSNKYQEVSFVSGSWKHFVVI